MNRKIKVLVITRYPWREDNNTGNSYSNLFAGMDDRIEFSQIYFRDGMPQNKLAKEYFHISEMQLLKCIFRNCKRIGEYIHLENPYDTPNEKFSSAFNKARALRGPLLLLIRDMAGFNKQWKSDELDAFIERVNPDIIFGILPGYKLCSDLMLYVKRKANATLITYPWDDDYSMHCTTLSPFYWIDKLMVRHYLKKTARESAFLYVISDIMKTEYSAIFRKKCKLLFKGRQFVNMPQQRPIEYPITLMYMGNMGCGRWKTLASIATYIQSINRSKGKDILRLKVYTLSAHTPEIEKSLNVEGASTLLPPVESKDIQSTLNSANILLHVEPWAEKDRYAYRASFSTKLVDYFYTAKCIMAVGGVTASTEYLKKRDAAIVINEKTIVEETLNLLCEQPKLIDEYAKKAWTCGYNNHQIEKIQTMLYNDFLNYTK